MSDDYELHKAERRIEELEKRLGQHSGQPQEPPGDPRLRAERPSLDALFMRAKLVSVVGAFLGFFAPLSYAFYPADDWPWTYITAAGILLFHVPLAWIVRSLGGYDAGLDAAVTVSLACPFGALPSLACYVLDWIPHTPRRTDVAVLFALGAGIVILLAWSNRVGSRGSR